ncbi:MAG: magnesium transporter [Anaeromyxobacteraceae bacterium]
MAERTRVRDLASTDYYAIPRADTVEQAVDAIRAAPDKAVFYCYAVDEGGRLAGVIPVRKLLTATRGTRIEDIMAGNVIALPAEGDRALMEDFFATYRFLAFPVVDADRRLLGVVQADAFSDQLMGEFEGRVRHDWLRSLGVSEEEGHASALGIVRLRLPWLLVTVASGLLSAFVTGAFHATLERIVALAFFVPVVLLVSESVGMQTSAVTVSSLSEDVPPLLRRLLAREVQAAALLGLACGLLVGTVGVLWLRDVRFATVLGATMTLTVSTASALAVGIPGLFRRIGVDPALAAAPLTLALTDNLTLLAYLAIAARLAA